MSAARGFAADRIGEDWPVDDKAETWDDGNDDFVGEGNCEPSVTWERKKRVMSEGCDSPT